MDRARHQLLAHAAFSGDQGGRAGTGHPLDQFHQPVHGLAHDDRGHAEEHLGGSLDRGHSCGAQLCGFRHHVGIGRVSVSSILPNRAPIGPPGNTLPTVGIGPEACASLSQYHGQEGAILSRN